MTILILIYTHIAVLSAGMLLMDWKNFRNQGNTAHLDSPLNDWIAIACVSAVWPLWVWLIACSGKKVDRK